MKIVITDILTANLDDVYLTIESKNWNVKDIMPLFKNQQLVSAAGGDATWDWYIDIPCAIQGVGSAAGAGTFIVLKDDGIVAYSNFAASTVGQFRANRNYLILHTATGVTPIVPSFPSTVAVISTGAATTTYSGIRYHFYSAYDQNPINSTSVDTIGFDVDMDALNRIINK